MATEQQKKGGRIYSGGSAAKTTYQGSAQSGGFNAVKAANSDKAMAEYRRRIVEDGDAKMRELRREQDATTTSLRAQQTADAGMLKLEGQREANALAIDQKYDQSTLKQEHTYEEHKMALESSHLQASGQVAASRIKVADSVIQGVASLSKSYLGYEAQRLQEVERKEAITATNKAVFGMEDNPDPSAGYQAQAAQNAGTVAATDSINGIDSPAVQNAIRREVSQATIEGQRQRASVYEAAADWPVFFNNWKNDTSVVYTRPSGDTFTVATMEAGDAVQVSEAARKAFYSSAGLGSMPQAQVAQVLVPQIMQQSGSWELDVSNKIIAGQQSAAVRSATMDIKDGLTAGDDMASVFDNGFTALNLSNAFNGKGEANKATVDTILEYAVNNNRPDVIEALDRLEKIPGNPGTRIGKQYAGEIKKARTDIMQGLVDKNRLDTNYASAAAETIERDLSLGLTKQGITDVEEQNLNQVAASKLMEHPTPENILRAKELLANKEYNPYTAQDMLISQANGTKYTQDELQALVNSKDIKATEAEQLGWDKSGGDSADTIRTNRVEDFRKLAEAQGTTILSTAAKDGGLGDSPEMIRIAVQGDGAAAKADIADRLLADLDAKLKTDEGSKMSDSEIREWMVNQRTLLQQEVEYQKGGGFVYNFGRDAYHSQTSNHDFRGLNNAELKSYNATNNVDLSSEKLLTGRQFDSAIYSIENGEPLPAELEERAAAIGTNAETLLRSQLALYGQPYPKVATPVEAMPTASSSDAGLAAYDTGEQFGGVSLDNLRNSVISKESAGVFTAENPDSGALGYGQVMPENVASWTTAALGYPVSQREYLRSPDIQMQVINDRFRKMMQQQSALGYTGDILVRRVASIWYSGNAGLYNNTRPQTYGAGTYPSIQSYTMDVVGRYRQG